MKKLFEELLKQFCDALLSVQFMETGGFMATEYTITPNTSGEIKLLLK